MSTAAAPIVVSSAPPPAAAPAAAAPVVDAAGLQKQIDDLKAASEENARAADFWKKKAETPAPTRAAAEPAAPAEEEEDVLDILATKGAKGLVALLAKSGYVRGEEVDARVNQKASEIQKEQALVAQYPDLKKENSEFFKETALAYGALVKQGVSKAVAMEMAAERTELKFLREGKMKTPTQQADEAKAEKDRLKRDRIAAQAGEGVRGRAPVEEEDDAELTPEQKHIADQMGITHEAYAARAKKGVQMKGIRA